MTAHWRAARLLSAPHRLGFFAGGVLFAVTALWWLLVLGTRAAGAALPWAVAPPLAHALLMSGAFMPFFIVGFLFTAGPRWLQQPDVDARTLAPPVAAMAAGWALALAGCHADARGAAAGVALVAAGWGMLVVRYLRIVHRSRVPDRAHAKAVAAACVLGVLGFFAAAAGLALGDGRVVRSATQLALWGFLVPVFAAVSHRMLPFFTASALPFVEAWRPSWLLAVLLVVPALEAASAVAAPWIDLPVPLAALLAAIEIAAGTGLLALALRWGLVASRANRLLAMLHGGFVWFGIALALAGASRALALASDGAFTLGLAPLHALTMGYLGITLVAMATRVASGHSGRPLAVDALAWRFYSLLQAAVVLRVAAAIAGAAQQPLLLAAAAAWAACTLAWAVRHGRWMGMPRADGRPG